MTPVPPGWVAVPAVQKEHPNEWFHIVGWTNDFQPVCAGIQTTGVFVWRTIFGEDGFIIATLKEWTGE